MNALDRQADATIVVDAGHTAGLEVALVGDAKAAVADLLAALARGPAVASRISRSPMRTSRGRFLAVRTPRSSNVAGQ